VNSVSIDRGVIASGSEDKTVAIWDPRHLLTPRQKLVGHRNWIRCIAVRGKYLISGSYDDTVKTWELNKGKCLFTFDDHHLAVEAVACDTFRLVSGDFNGKCMSWDFRFPPDGSVERDGLKRKFNGKGIK